MTDAQIIFIFVFEIVFLYIYYFVFFRNIGNIIPEKGIVASISGAFKRRKEKQ